MSKLYVSVECVSVRDKERKPSACLYDFCHFERKLSMHSV